MAGIIISEQTHRFVRHHIDARKLDVVAVAGKTEPCRVYELLAPMGHLTPTQQQLNVAYAEG